MKKINLLLLFLIFVSSCSVNQKHQAIEYYDKTVDVKKCSNLICRKHRIHYNEAGIFFKNDIKLKKWKTKVTKVGGTILKKVAKLKKLLDNTEDTKKIDLEKRIESREIRAAQLKKAYDQIEAVRKTL